MPPECPHDFEIQCYNDHRWAVEFKVTHDFWLDEYAQKSYTKAFTKENWQSKLREIHQYAWSKWDLARADFPLEDGQEEQHPGVVDPDVLQSLAPIVAGLPVKKKY